MSAVGKADGEAVGKENPLTPRSILRRNKVGGSPANGSVQKRVTFEVWVPFVARYGESRLKLPI